MTYLPCDAIIRIRIQEFLIESQLERGWIGRIVGFSDSRRDSRDFWFQFINLQWTSQLVRFPSSSSTFNIVIIATCGILSERIFDARSLVIFDKSDVVGDVVSRVRWMLFNCVISFLPFFSSRFFPVTQWFHQFFESSSDFHFSNVTSLEAWVFQLGKSPHKFHFFNSTSSFSWW